MSDHDLTVAEVAQRLRISPSAVRNFLSRSEGRLPHYRYGRAIRIRPADLTHWKESRRVY